MSSNYAEFEKVIQKFAKETNQKVKDVTKKSALRIYRGITYKTAVGNPSSWQSANAPSGYVGGTLRASLTINAESLDKSVAPYYTSAYPKPKLGQLKDNPTIFIGSNLPYTDRVLLKGWSKQTPKNMAKDITLKEFKKLESGVGI